MRYFLAAILFVTAIGAAHWYTIRSWNGTVYVYIGERRAPATVRKVHEYSGIDYHALYRSVHEQLMAGAQVFKENGHVGIRLGHPLIPRAEDGSREFACEVPGHDGPYDRIEMSFYGTGITENGRTPTLSVDMDCAATGRLDYLDTVWLPMQDIVSTPPRDQDIGVPGERPFIIRLKNMPDVWPENWVLWSVRFYREDDANEAIFVDAAHLREAAPMLSFDWKK